MERLQAASVAPSLLASGRSIRMRVEGWSMKPLIPGGSLVRVDPLDGPPRRGEVVLYRTPNGGLVAHRVVTYRPDWICLKGDACLEMDAPVQPSELLGRVAAIEEPYCLALTGVFPRLVGRLLGWLTPRLVRARDESRRLLGASLGARP